MINEKWVRVMFDYSSSGLWEESGCMMEPSDLPVTQELKSKINSWVNLYDKHEWESESINMKYDGETEFSDDDKNRLNELDILCEEDFKKGILLAIEIKAQLPDWTVKVFNNSYGVLSLPEDENFNSEITSNFKFR